MEKKERKKGIKEKAIKKRTKKAAFNLVLRYYVETNDMGAKNSLFLKKIGVIVEESTFNRWVSGEVYPSKDNRESIYSAIPEFKEKCDKVFEKLSESKKFEDEMSDLLDKEFNELQKSLAGTGLEKWTLEDYEDFEKKSLKKFESLKKKTTEKNIEQYYENLNILKEHKNDYQFQVSINEKLKDFEEQLRKFQ